MFTRTAPGFIHDNTRLIENIFDREFPEQTIPVKASIREAIDIFYKVNASGVALTDAELALAHSFPKPLYPPALSRTLLFDRVEIEHWLSAQRQGRAP